MYISLTLLCLFAAVTRLFAPYGVLCFALHYTNYASTFQILVTCYFTWSRCSAIQSLYTNHNVTHFQIE